ncbi:MAG: hypothetical protein ACXVAU_05250 [Mucilaginibacter sp.]
MIKSIITLTLLFGDLVNHTVSGQTFTIRSANGKDEKIQMVTDPEKDKLTITYLKDTLFVHDIINIEKAKILSKNFLEIVYTIGGGSGLHIKRTLILSVNNKVICQSLDIMSFLHEEFIDYSKQPPTPDAPDVISHYRTTLDLAGSDSQNYKLQVKIHDEQKSKDAPRTNYKRDNETILNYDAAQQIFYSTHQRLSRYFTVYDPKTQKNVKKYMLGTFPVVKLGKNEYYYIKGEWYDRGDGGSELSKYTYK